MKKNQALHIRIEPERKSKLESLAMSQGLNISQVITLLIDRLDEKKLNELLFNSNK